MDFHLEYDKERAIRQFTNRDSVVEAIVSYTENPFDHQILRDRLDLPLDSEPHVARWRYIRERSPTHRYLRCLKGAFTAI